MTINTGVTTRYYSPTDFRGSRIRVTWRGDKKFIPYDYATSEDAHVSAVREAFRIWGYEVADVTYVAESESGRGDVYSVKATS